MRALLWSAVVMLVLGAWAWSWLSGAGNAPGSGAAAGPAAASHDVEVAAAIAPAALAAAAQPDRTAAVAGPAGGDGMLAVFGVVLGPRGEPLTAARVSAESSEAEEYSLLDAAPRQRRLVADVRTAADGSYRLALPAGRPCLLRAEADGCAPQARGGCLGGSRVDFRLAAGAVLRGTVRRAVDGRAVAATRIAVVQDVGLGSGVRVGEAVTDAAGAYRIDTLPAGTCRVDVLPERLAVPRDVEVLLQSGAVTVHDVLLVDGVTIRGVVLDAVTRIGVVGALVGDGGVASGADGAFEVSGFDPANQRSLRVRAAGYADTEVVLGDGRTPAAAIPRHTEVLLQRGRQARGRVVDEANRPLAGVYVAAGAADQGAAGPRVDWRAGRTGADGGFLLDGLRADMPHTLLLLHRGFGTAVYEFPPDEAQQTDIDFGELRLLPPGSLSGRVTDERDQPVQDYDVAVSGHNADRWRGRAPEEGYRAIDTYVAERHCRTDAAGRFHFADLAAGDYTVWVMKIDSHEQLRERRTVARAEQVTGVEMRLSRGLSIDGALFVLDGGPLPTCYCSIDPEDGQGTSGDVEVRRDGTFRVAGLAPGNYSVTVYPYPTEADRAVGRAFASLVHRAVAAGATGVRFEVPVSGPLRGVVLDAERAPLAGAAIGALEANELLSSATTDATGAFVLTVPWGRSVRVLVCPPGPTGEPMVFDAARSVASAEGAVGGPPLEIVLRR